MRIPKAIRDKAEERLRHQRAIVKIEDLSEGDIVEFSELNGPMRFGRVYHIQPRARRVVVGSMQREDLPHGYKSLADLATWRQTIVEQQVRSIYRKKVTA